MARIYTFSPSTAYSDWAQIIAAGDTITVAEFETYDEAVTAYEDRYNDPDVYGVA